MATNLERMQIMMEEIGPSMPEIEAVIQSENTNWAIQFEDQSIVMLEWAEQPDRVVLTTMLGTPSESMQLSVYETLLCYNLLWRDNGGVKVGLAGPQGALIISAEVCLEGMSLMNLQEELNKFLKITRSWVQHIAQASESGDAEPPALPGMGNMHLHA